MERLIYNEKIIFSVFAVLLLVRGGFGVALKVNKEKQEANPSTQTERISETVTTVTMNLAVDRGMRKTICADRVNLIVRMYPERNTSRGNCCGSNLYCSFIFGWNGNSC